MSRFNQSAGLKREIEAKLASRVPAALSPRPQPTPRLIASGSSKIDALLGGGLELGGISEFTGLQSSGRTTLALALLAQASIESACAYVDVSDSLDPRSAAAAGGCLRNLLWVRLDAVGQVVRGQELRSSSTLSTNVERLKERGGHHPPNETKGVARALTEMIAREADARIKKMEGTPGYPNQKISLAATQEQIEYESFNARPADELDPIRKADQRAAIAARQRSLVPVNTASSTQKQQRPWSRLDKAIRATDQILQSGGFRVVVLDLASVPVDQALRIPSATWFRFRRAAQESDAVLLLLTQVACARSSALCVLECSAREPEFLQDVFSRLVRAAEVARQRKSSTFTKKAPGRVTTWEATPSWMRAAGR